MGEQSEDNASQEKQSEHKKEDVIQIHDCSFQRDIYTTNEVSKWQTSQQFARCITTIPMPALRTQPWHSVVQQGRMKFDGLQQEQEQQGLQVLPGPNIVDLAQRGRSPNYGASQQILRVSR